MLTHNEELTLELLKSIENPNPEQLELIKELKAKQSKPESEDPENSMCPMYVVKRFLNEEGITDVPKEKIHLLATNLLANEYTTGRCKLAGVPKELYDFINPLEFQQKHPLANFIEQIEESGLPDINISNEVAQEFFNKNSKIITMVGEYAMTATLEAFCRSASMMTVIRLIDGVMIESSIKLAYMIYKKDPEKFPICKDILLYGAYIMKDYFTEKMPLILQNLALLNLRTDFDDLYLREPNQQLEEVQNILRKIDKDFNQNDENEEIIPTRYTIH